MLGTEQDKVSVRKCDCGLPGSKVYVANQITATQSLLSKFLDSFHLQSKNAAGKNVQKSKHIQDKLVLKLDILKKFKERVHQYDMMTPLQVPAVYRDIVGEGAWDARWDALNPYCEIVISLFTGTNCRWTTVLSGSVTLMDILLMWIMSAASG